MYIWVILCVFDSFRRRGNTSQDFFIRVIKLDQLVEIYTQIVRTCCKAISTCSTAQPSIEDDVIEKVSGIVAVVTGLLFSDSSTAFPLAKAYLCLLEPKWRSSFSRLMSLESNSNESTNTIFMKNNKADPVKEIQEAISPIIDALANFSQLKENIIQLVIRLDDDLEMSLDGLSYGVLTKQTIVRLAKQGSLLINAWDGFLQIGTDQDPLFQQQPTQVRVKMETVNQIFSLTTLLDINMFLIICQRLQIESSEQEGEEERLAFKLLQIASNDPLESNRLMIFRCFASFVNHRRGQKGDTLEFLVGLIKREDLIDEQMNIKISLINLIRETLTTKCPTKEPQPGASYFDSNKNLESTIKLIKDLIIYLINPIILEITAINCFLLRQNQQEIAPPTSYIDEYLKLLVEKLNFIFLLIKLDQQNLVGIKNGGSLNLYIKEKLITPIFNWIQTINNQNQNQKKLIHHHHHQQQQQQIQFDNLIFSVQLALDLCIQSIT